MTSTASPEPEPRSYSLGLPVTIEVRPDGTVHAYVDLAEAGRRRDLRESQEYCEPGEQIGDEQIDADSEVISAAVQAGTVTLHDAWASES